MDEEKGETNLSLFSFYFMSKREDDKHCVIHTQTQGGTRRSTKFDILISIDIVGPR